MTRRAVLSLSVAGATGLAGCGAVTRDCPIPGTADIRSDWPHRYHDLGNTNAAPDGPDTLSERWVVRVEARLERPLVADGTVYTTATTDPPTEARILAFDVDSGESAWKAPLGEESRARIAGVVDGRVYVIGRRAGNDDRQRLYAVDEGGSVAWTFDTNWITAVAAAEEVVFVSVLHGSIVALDAVNGRPCTRFHPSEWPGGRWLSDLTPVGRPAVHDRTVFAPVARYDDDRADDFFEDQVVAFEAGGGARWKSTNLDAFVVEEVTAVAGTVYVPVTHQQERGGQAGKASLYALEAGSGTRRWKRQIESGSISTVSARDDVVVVTASDGMRAFNPRSGSQRWHNEHLLGPPVIGGDRAYGRRTEGAFVDTVAAASLETGEVTASYTFDYQVNRAPVFTADRAIVRTLEYGESGHVADRLHGLR